MLNFKRMVHGVVLTTAIFGGFAFAEPVPQQPTSTIEAPQTSTRISLNSANAETLAEHLTGVGLAKAEAIVAWREANGRFESVEQLLEVKGIGEATLQKNLTRLTL